MKAPIVATLIVLLSLSGTCSAECRAQSSLGGIANQGGYTFDYESDRGSACVLHQVRNRPGKVFTPVIWNAGNAVLLETALHQCNTQSECEWFGASLTATAPPVATPTKLSFGLNRDQYTATPEAYLPNYIDTKSAGLSGLTTLLEGVVAENEKERTRIAISVSSKVKDLGGKDGYMLVYSIGLVGESAPMRFLAAVSENGPNDLAAVWEAARGSVFTTKLHQLKLGTQTPKTSPVTIEVPAKSLSLESTKVLAIYRGARRIAATSAPAYVQPE